MMAPINPSTEPGHWFLRGVQSALFYYVSCSPWLEHKHKRKRRKEAKQYAQERAEIITTQPGLISQPAPFQTNEAWTEEITLGPGPPKGWQKETLLRKLQKKIQLGPGEPEVASSYPSTPIAVLDPPPPARRPLKDRIMSGAADIKDSLMANLHPPQWNWQRYHREDEILIGVTDDETRRHPEIHDLHTPIISQLPATREEAAWMLLPAPSADVMAARARPAAEAPIRRPLCVVGRPIKKTDPELRAARTLSTDQVDSMEVFSANEHEYDEESSDEDESDDSAELPTANQTPSRIKHYSDPIAVPPSIYTTQRYSDLLIPKRRGSWQFHYVVPSN